MSETQVNVDYRPLAIEPWFRFITATEWTSQLILPQFQSHWGYYSGGMQENTLEAFRKARTLGSQMCECDVRFSGDGVAVIFHDADLKRIGSRDVLTQGLSFKELKTVAKVCSLEEMLTDSEVTPYFNVELKTSKIDDTLSVEVARVIKKVGAEQRVLFSSFNPFALWKLQKLLPMAPRALLLTNLDHKDNRWWLRRMVMAPLLKIHMLNLDQAMLDEHVISYWSHQRVPLAAWTVNDPARAKTLLKMGVKSIISDLSPDSV